MSNLAPKRLSQDRGLRCCRIEDGNDDGDDLRSPERGVTEDVKVVSNEPSKEEGIASHSTHRGRHDGDKKNGGERKFNERTGTERKDGTGVDTGSVGDRNRRPPKDGRRTRNKENEPPPPLPVTIVRCEECSRDYDPEVFSLHRSQCAFLRAQTTTTVGYGYGDDDLERLRQRGPGSKRQRRRRRWCAPFVFPDGGDAQTYRLVGGNDDDDDDDEETDDERCPVPPSFDYDEHEQAWSNFERTVPFTPLGSVGREDVPFLPSFVTGLDLVGLRGVKVNSACSQYRECKNASSVASLLRNRLRNATVRWHPDKFLQKFGDKLKARDEVEIMERVKDCSQRINSLRNEVGR